MHLWGKRRVPTLHWIWAPWLGDGSLEVRRSRCATRSRSASRRCALDGPDEPLRGRPATAAHPNGLVTSTVAGARRLDPRARVGRARRRWSATRIATPTIATSWSRRATSARAHFEVFTRDRAGRAVAARRRAPRRGRRRRRDPSARAAARRRLHRRGTRPRARRARRPAQPRARRRRRVARGHARSSRSA